MALKKALEGNAEIVATVICGDSYFNENLESAKIEILEMIKKYNPDLFIAGPAFNAGRYGVACGSIAKAVKEDMAEDKKKDLKQVVKSDKEKLTKKNESGLLPKKREGHKKGLGV